MSLFDLFCREKVVLMSSNKEDEIKSLRLRSGHVQIDSKLVSFLYELMRDHLPAGVVEHLVQEASQESKVVYTNGWLAQYAQDLANRLKDQ